MRLITIAYTVSILALAATALHAASRDELPNIIILYADDLGYGDLQCYNSKSKIPTPHLDRLAAEGMRFTDGHCSSGICSPSRYALLTGSYHWRVMHDIVKEMEEPAIAEKTVTLPEMLGQAGYATGMVGKWHLGWGWKAISLPQKNTFRWDVVIPGGPTSNGFDYYSGDGTINFPPYAWIVNDRVATAPTLWMDNKRSDSYRWKEGKVRLRPGPLAEDWSPYEVLPRITKDAVEYVSKHAKRKEPFFLYVAFSSPHTPIIPQDDFDRKSRAGAYGDFVVQTDWACGRILDALKRSGEVDNTIIIFTADNGPENIAYVRDKKYGHWSSAPLRGVKRDIYEGGHRVPFIVRWPDEIRKRAVCDELVSQIDLMATLAAVAGVDLKRDMAIDSFNLLPLWKGKGSSPRTSHVHNTFDKWAYREGEWVLIDAGSGHENSKRKYQEWETRHGYSSSKDKGKGKGKGKVELYNIEKDISQRQNLAASNPKMVAQLRKKLKEMRASSATASH